MVAVQVPKKCDHPPICWMVSHPILRSPRDKKKDGHRDPKSDANPGRANHKATECAFPEPIVDSFVASDHQKPG